MSRRSGGRKSRIANRLSPLSGEIKPVLPGESGGMYKPLSDKNIQAIIDNSFKILEQVGFSQASQHCIDICTERGAVLGNDGRLRIQGDLVEETIKVSNHNVKLYGQDPAHDLDLTGNRVHFSTGGAAVMILDSESREHRQSQARDLYDMPVLLLSAAQAGATAPPCLAGTVSQAWAEALGGLVYVNSI